MVTKINARTRVTHDFETYARKIRKRYEVSSLRPPFGRKVLACDITD